MRIERPFVCTRVQTFLRRPAFARAAGIAALLALLCAPPVGAASNIIVVIADDVGAEWFAPYGDQQVFPPTPTIDSLAQQGVLFRSAWATPVCSPFRVSAFTGRYPGEHGVGHGINGGSDDRDFVLDPSAPNLAHILSAAGYRTAAVGKWHMATELGWTGANFWDGIVSVTEGHPNLAGMDYFAGFLFGGLLYFNWPKTVNGVSSYVQTYATTDTANEAIGQISGSEPYFLWIAFNAPHAVIHTPPLELLSDPSRYDFSRELDQWQAMIEAMDTELGRIMDSVDLQDTTILFVADNGALGNLLQPPRLISHGKATVYEGGVHVPLIIAGQAVAGGARGQESTALVQATDFFPTVLEIAGLEPPPRRDAVSMLPYLADPALPSQRETVYTEMFIPNGGPIARAEHDRAARGIRYKLVRNGLDPYEFYDLETDPYELSPLDLSSLSPAEKSAFYALLGAIQDRHTTLAKRVPALPIPALALLGFLLLGMAFRQRA